MADAAAVQQCNVKIKGSCTVQEKENLYAASLAQPDTKWQVHIAKAGQAVDISSGSASHHIAVSDQLMKQLHFRNMDNYLVTWFSAGIGPKLKEVHTNPCLPCKHRCKYSFFRSETQTHEPSK